MKNVEQHFSEKSLLTTYRHETQSSKSVRICSDPIPDDLLIEIFSRVPGKSIARFRCISKLWASIFRRSDFTELFLTKSFTRPRLLFTVEADGKFFFYSTPQPQNPDDNSSLVATPYHHNSVLLDYPDYIRKPVCGLVLLQGSRRRGGRMICNPGKGKVLSLPKVPKAKKNSPMGLYFGYDPIGKQFKVLCMKISHYKSRPNTHWILTLESGKRLWRTIEQKFHFREDNRIVYGEICINGVLYFGGELEESSMIVCFDIRSEKFGFINIHKDMTEPYGLTLFNYKGKLGTKYLRDEEELVLWVLEDAGNHKWSKHIQVLMTPLGKGIVGYNRFHGITCTGEIVYYCDQLRPPCFFFYNLEMNTFARVNIQGLEELEHYRIVEMFPDYVENMMFM